MILHFLAWAPLKNFNPNCTFRCSKLYFSIICRTFIRNSQTSRDVQLKKGDFTLIKQPLPTNESHRIAAVLSYNLLDTPPEKDFDSITALTATLCDAPVAMIALLDEDRVFIKSHYGCTINDIPRDFSISTHAILDKEEVFVVEDCTKDLRFKDNPFLKKHGIVFYAGVRLRNPDGFSLGTLCVIDDKPKKLKEKQRVALMALSKQIINLLEARKQNEMLLKIQRELRERNDELKNFAGTVSHDMKMPLANMIVTADMLKKKYGNMLDTQGHKYLDYLKQSAFTLSEYISGMLQHYETEQTASKLAEPFDSQDLFEEIVELLNINLDCEIHFPDENIEMQANKAALEQILLNIIGNSIKYNDKDKIKIQINCCQNDQFYYFAIKDNGMGISKDKIESVFELFGKTGVLDRDGNTGNGIGLATVKKLVTKLKGHIDVASTLGVGTTVEFSVKKPFPAQ